MRSSIKFGLALMTGYTAFTIAIARTNDKVTLAILAATFVVSVTGLFIYYALKDDD